MRQLAVIIIAALLISICIRADAQLLLLNVGGGGQGGSPPTGCLLVGDGNNISVDGTTCISAS